MNLLIGSLVIMLLILLKFPKNISVAETHIIVDEQVNLGLRVREIGDF